MTHTLHPLPEPELNVTLLPPAQKHATIFARFDALEQGQRFTLLNDHDPRPLYYQFVAERGQQFHWRYLEQGPQWWRVEIEKNPANTPTVGELAASDLRKAAVFRKLDIDFCCGGRQTLAQACTAQGLNEPEVAALLDQAAQTGSVGTDFNLWSPVFLSEYILNQHHGYWYREEPLLTELIAKVSAHHGAHNPALRALEQVFSQLRKELNTHFYKEEKAVFPAIRMALEGRPGDVPGAAYAPAELTLAVQLMEADHDEAAGLLGQLHALTDGYSAPDGSCNSVRLLYYQLERLDEDLRQHIHLENNILFPKVRAQIAQAFDGHAADSDTLHPSC